MEPMSYVPMPVGDRVMIKQFSIEEKSALAIPDEAKGEMKQAQGRIIAIGGGEEIAKLGLEGSQTVFFNKFAGERLVHNGEEFLLLRPQEILAKLVVV